MPRFSAFLALPVLAAFAAAQTPCDQLKLSLPQTEVTSIQFVPAGPFVAPSAPAADPAAAPAPAAPAGRAGGRGPAGPAASVPAYCRVQMVLMPSSDSHIEAAMF